MPTSKLPAHSFALVSAAALAAGVVSCSSTPPPAAESTSESAAATSSASPPAESSPAAPTGQGNDGVLEMPRLSIDAATQAAQAALASCQSGGLPFVSVAVVDRFGQVQVMLRGDNAAEHTSESARMKGYTAAAFGANTSELSERASGDGATIRDLPGTLFLPGGVTVKSGDASIAGIGVGGAPQGAADEACAQAGLDAIADSLGG